MYEGAINRYMDFCKRTPKELLEEAVEDLRKFPTEKTNIVSRRIVDFYNYLLADAEKIGLAGRHHTKSIGKGFSKGSARTYVACVQAFYTFYEVPLKRLKIPNGKVEHERLILTQEQVKKMYDSAQNQRDKALVLFFYQTGCDVSTVTSIKYRQVQRGLESNEEPLRIDLVREKTDRRYFTFLGAEGIYALKNYLMELKSKIVALGLDDHLFVERIYKGKVKGLSIAGAQRVFRVLAKRIGLYDEGSKQGYNVAGSHALRETFSSTLWNNGMDREKVEFLLGHGRGTISEAYLKQDSELLRKAYKSYEKYLSIGLLEIPAVVDSKRITELEEELAKTNKAYDVLLQTSVSVAKRLELLEKEAEKWAERENDYRSYIEKAARQEDLKRELANAKTEEEEEAIYRKHGYRLEGEKIEVTEAEKEFVKKALEKIKKKGKKASK